MKKIIIYSLENATAQDYANVNTWISDNFNNWAKIDETTFFVFSSNQIDTSKNIRDRMKNELNVPWDRIIISNWEHDSAWYGLPNEVSEWLKSF